MYSSLRARRSSTGCEDILAPRREALHKWISYHMETPLFVAVTEPRQLGGVAGLGKTWQFTISCTEGLHGETHTVQRQWREFSQLHGAIQDRFPGLMLPQLPHEHKSDVVKSKENLLEKRCHLLHLHLCFMAEHPFVRRDEVFKAFLLFPQKFSTVLQEVKTMGSRASLAIRSDTQSATDPRSKWSAMDWWNEAIALAEEPLDPGGHIKLALQALTHVQKGLSGLKSSMKKLQERSSAMGTAYVELGDAFSSLLGREKRAGGSLKPPSESSPFGHDQAASNNTPIVKMDRSSTGRRRSAQIRGILQVEKLRENLNYDKQVANVIHTASCKSERQATVYKASILQLEAEVITSVRHELLCVQGMRTQLQLVRDKIEKYAEAQRQVDSLSTDCTNLEAKIKCKSTGDMAKLANKLKGLEKQLEETSSTASACKEAASRISRAVLVLELDRYTECRRTRLTNLDEALTQVQIGLAKESIRAWRSDENDVEGEAQASFRISRSRKQRQQEVVVKFDFEAEHEDELSVKAGQTGIAMPWERDNRWILLQIELPDANVKTGVVPRDYVEPIARAERIQHDEITRELEKLRAELAQIKHDKAVMEQSLSDQLSIERENHEQAIQRAQAEIQHQRSMAVDSQDELQALKDGAGNECDSKSKATIEKLQHELHEARGKLQENHQLKEKLQDQAAEIEQLKHELRVAKAAEQDAKARLEKIGHVQRKHNHNTKSTPVVQENETSNSFSNDKAPMEGTDWIKCFDNRYKREYYYNPKTKKSQWNQPEGFVEAQS